MKGHQVFEMSAVCVSCVLLLCVAACLAENVVAKPVVKTTAGPIQGETFEYPSGRLSRYLGVPYGRPTGGSLRFTAPQTPEPWTETRDTTAYPHRCFQNTMFDEKISLSYDHVHPEVSEDCLYLNVYAPVSSPDEKRAVMVWFHGGGFVMGAGSEYPMEALTLAGDVIGVSINYRLDIFGFIATDDDRAAGNAGFHDQALALRWVQDNIVMFGGDPDKVTIFGESAGGMSVSAHVVSPLSRGLFTRAISQSGSLYGLGLETREERAERTRGLAASLDCPSTTEANMLTCLQNVPADKLLKATTESQFMIMSPGPTVGDAFLPQLPSTLHDEHNINPGVDYMIGVNSEDALFFLWMLPENETENYLQNGISPEDPIFEMLLAVGAMLPPSQAHLGGLVKECVKAQYLPDIQDRFGVFRGLFDAAADKLFVACALGAAARMAETDQKVYLYYFDNLPTSKLDIPIPILKGAPEMELGAAHGTDVFYMFGWPYVEGVPFSLVANTTEEDKAISKSMVNTWTTFAKTGKMTVLLDDGSEMDWPEYDKTNQTYLKWKHPMTSSSLKTRLRPRANSFWNVLIPALLEQRSKTPAEDPKEQKDEL